MRIFRRITITEKFLTLALLISATAWGILDCFQSRIFEEIFNHHLAADLQGIADKDRELFDSYLASFHQSVHLLIFNQKFTNYVFSSEWNKKQDNTKKNIRNNT
ncbi:hypothetical protein VU04_05235, partial [Desulfobulbus sp. TB]|nr:hypothetical protein [Desulfobulbus sp. TB]